MTTAQHEPQQLLTVNEVAERLRLSRYTIYRLISAGTIPAVRVGQGRFAPLRVDAAELHEFIYGPGHEEDN